MKTGRVLTRHAAPAVAILGFSALWALHVVLTQLGDPLGLTFDVVLWILASCLKLVSLLLLPLLLAATYRVVAGSRRRALSAFVVWAVMGTIVVLTLAWTRDSWAGRISNDTVRYYAQSEVFAGPPDVQAHQTRWRLAWGSGRVVAAELVLVGLLAAGHALVGFILGDRPGRAVAMGYAATATLLLTYLLVTPWCLLTYDNFHGDVFPGALLFDSLLVFVANDPYSTLALPFYLAAIASAYIIIRVHSGIPSNTLHGHA